MLITEIKKYIIDDFTHHLQATDLSLSNNEYMLIAFGENYVSYFMQNPPYYKFLLNQPNFHFSISETSIACDDFAPFPVFISAVKQIMRQQNIPEDEISLNIIVAISMVVGLTQILVSENIEYVGDHKHLMSKILKEKLHF